jgi:uncharacterized membrane protein
MSMAEPPERSLEERLAALETAVESLQRKLAFLPESRRRSAGEATSRPMAHPTAVRTGSPPPLAAPDAIRHPPLPRAPSPPGFFTKLLSHGPEFWISRVGIGLLLAGVAYLFKYAVDQGWLTPPIRVAFGVTLGMALAAIGLRVHAERRWFAQIMLGGAAATWYITGFAAFQLLQLVSFPTALAFMVAVTVFTFWAGLKQNEAVLAVLAALGGLSTPFLLYTESGSVPGLMAYTSVVLAGTSAIYLFRGWPSLLWTTAVGAWLVVALGFRPEASADRMALQSGIAVIWLLFWLVPVSREVLADRNPARWSRPTPGGGPSGFASMRDRAPHGLAALVLATAVMSLFASRAVWGAGNWAWGTTGLLGAIAYGFVATYLSPSKTLVLLASAHRVTAATLLAIAIALLFEPDVVLVLWVLEAAALHLLAPQLATRGVAEPEESVLRIDTAAHVLYAVAGVWLFARIVSEVPPVPAVLNVRAAADAAAVAIALLTAARLEPRARLVYRLVAHAAILGLLLRELGALPGGDGIVTAAWGLYALGLLVLVRGARRIAVVTLFLAVAKLVLHDLSQVEAIWRILLFLGFGGVFLAISYYVPDLWSRTTPPE